MAEIAEALARNARRCEQREQRIERVGDPGDVETLGDHGVEAGAFKIAADVKRVETRQAADDADIAIIGPGAAVRAPGNAHTEAFVLQAPEPQPRRDHADDLLANALGLGQLTEAERVREE